MNRYNGITGRYEVVPEPETYLLSLPPVNSEAEREESRIPSGQSGILGGLGGLGGIFSKNGLGGILSNNGLGGILSNNGLDGKLGGGLGGILGGLGGGLSGILGGPGGKSGGGLGGILSKFTKFDFELEDIMLVAVLYLLYRESHDVEFLLIAGAMLFL